MITENNKYTKDLLRRAIEHNNHVYSTLSNMIAEAFEISKSDFNYGDNTKAPIENIVSDAMLFFKFFDDDDFLSYFYRKTNKKCPKFCANIIRASAKSKDLLIDSLIKELNNSYYNVRNIQPDTSNY